MRGLGAAAGALAACSGPGAVSQPAPGGPPVTLTALFAADQGPDLFDASTSFTVVGTHEEREAGEMTDTLVSRGDRSARERAAPVVRRRLVAGSLAGTGGALLL